MAALNPYRISAKAGVLLLLLSCVLPLHRSGEYVPGYASVALLVRTVPQSVSHLAGVVYLVSFVLFFLLLCTILVWLHLSAPSRGVRAIALLLFLATTCSALVANSHAHVYPAGPAAVALLASAIIAILGLVWRCTTGDCHEKTGVLQ